MRRIIPLLGTVQEVKLGEFRSHFHPRNTFVADCIVGFPQVWPHLNGHFERRYSDQWIQSNERSLDGTSHRGHDNQVWDCREFDELCGRLPSLRKWGVTMRVIAIDAIMLVVSRNISLNLGLSVLLTHLWSDCPCRMICTKEGTDSTSGMENRDCILDSWIRLLFYGT